jgi:colicin import membrane protein
VTYNDITQNERTLSGTLALVMHLLFFALLVFGVSWQKKQSDSAVMVDLWNNLPPQPKIETPPPPAEVKPPPEPPKPVPKVETKPVPKPETKPVVKPDIALKEKLEKERKQKEQEKLEEKKREQEKARLAALKEKQAKAAEAKRLAREQDEALKKLAQQQAAQAAQAAAQARLVDEYRRRISDKIRRFVVLPPNLQGNPEVQFDVVLLPGGEVLSTKLKKSSGATAYDSAVERAILKAQPLPLPPDPSMFGDFRELNLKFRPKE